MLAVLEIRDRHVIPFVGAARAKRVPEGVTKMGVIESRH